MMMMMMMIFHGVGDYILGVSILQQSLLYKFEFIGKLWLGVDH